MLTTFPSLLMYGFFVPMIIRIAAACVFAYLAVTHFKNKKAVAKEIPFVGHEMAVWAAGLLILAELAVAVALFVGAWTQIAAIVGLVAAIKALLIKRRFPAVYPLTPLSFALLGVLCATLIISGAGAFAFDLPL